MQFNQRPIELARREANWRESIETAERGARAHFQAIGSHLDLSPDRTRALVNACLEAARQYQAACSYANYEHRTGHPWPDEWHDAEEDRWEVAWSGALHELDDAVRRSL